ncbi:hypothetical protein B566_EDAN008834 [Ephemera danica]|nr:hypothetical protein B566_EDAN008834 [Ephemera danica]
MDLPHANPRQTPTDDDGLKAAVDSNVYFSLHLYSQVVGDSNSNVVMSPLSAQLALALANLGARGNNANQISTALNIQQNAQPNFAQLINLLLLGMTDMFSRDVGDFSGLVDGGPRLYVSKVLQKTYLKLTLQGTEAASTTTMTDTTRGLVKVNNKTTIQV